MLYLLRRGSEVFTTGWRVFFCAVGYQRDHNVLLQSGGSQLCSMREQRGLRSGAGAGLPIDFFQANPYAAAYQT